MGRLIFLLLFVFFYALLIAGTVFHLRSLGMERNRIYGLTAAILIISTLFAMQDDEWPLIVPVGITVSNFIILLISKWSLGRISEEESEPSMRGLQAWLSPIHLTLCAAVTFSFWLARYDYPLIALFLCLFLLMVYPLINMLSVSQSTGSRPFPPQGPKITKAREKVLDLLEREIITPQECLMLWEALRLYSPDKSKSHSSEET